MIYALIGISGVGKSYLTKYVLANCDRQMNQLLAVTTRERRNQEIDGIDKYFLSDEQFEAQKSNLVLVRRMYGAFYGFRTEDLETKRNLIVELYYKDYIKMKKEGYLVKGVYVWTSDCKCRRCHVRRRNNNRLMYIKREIDDFYINFIHKIMLGLGLFDYAICNHYDGNSEVEILNIVESKGSVE